MSLGGGSAPSAPDPAVSASAQAGYNTQAAVTQAQLNRINQYTPLGASEYEQTGSTRQFDQTRYNQDLAAMQAGQRSMGSPESYYTDIPTYKQTTTLTPDAQAVLSGELAQDRKLQEASGGLLNQVQSNINTPYSYAGLPQVPGSNDLMGYQKQVTNDIYGRLTPELDRQKEQLDAQMANQGITQGSTAYNNAMDQFGRQSNDAYQQADITANSQMQNLFNMGLQNRQQSIDEYGQQYNQPLNQLNAIRSTSQVTMPSFSSVPQVQVGAGNYQSAAQNQYQGQLNNYNSGVAGGNSLMGGLFSLGGALGSAGIMASDRRLKKEIRPIGTYKNGIPKYLFKYNWEDKDRIGAMADEVRKFVPDAVVRGADGFDRVNYDLVGE